jgi:hypothetical protein
MPAEATLEPNIAKDRLLRHEWELPWVGRTELVLPLRVISCREVTSVCSVQKECNGPGHAGECLPAAWAAHAPGGWHSTTCCRWLLHAPPHAPPAPAGNACSQQGTAQHSKQKNVQHLSRDMPGHTRNDARIRYATPKAVVHILQASGISETGLADLQGP